MAARIIRQATADEVRHHGGVQFGDFGTGGRTYSYYSRGASASSDVNCRRIIGGLVLLSSFVWLYLAEHNYSVLRQCASHAEKTAVVVHSPFLVEGRNTGRNVFLAAPSPVVTAPPPFDPFFGIEMPHDAVTVKRVTEYCQWQEIQHRNKVLVGRDANCQHNDDRCNIYREDVSFSYVKGWHSYLISSALFDNPVAYHNPQRDPCPSETFHAPNGIIFSASAVGALRVSAEDASPALGHWKKLPLEHTIAHVTQQALQAGFGESDAIYIYSRGNRDGWLEPVVRAAAAYFVDGVAGVSFGTCHAGDIRVHFDVRQITPKGMAIAGMQSEMGTLVPLSCPNKNRMVLGYPDAGLTLHEMLEHVVGDARWWLWIYRCGIVALTAIGLALFPGYLCNIGPMVMSDRQSAVLFTVVTWSSVWFSCNEPTTTATAATLCCLAAIVFWTTRSNPIPKDKPSSDN